MYNQMKVLVVDDMRAMRKIITKVIKEMGVGEILDAEDGNLAWKHITEAETPFHLIISDWNMPNCTGIELLKKVREDSKFKNLPLILLTAEAEAHQVSEAVKLGVSGYIVKPFTPDILKQKLTALFAKTKAA